MLKEKAPVEAGFDILELSPPKADGFSLVVAPVPRRFARIITRCFKVDSPALKKFTSSKKSQNFFLRYFITCFKRLST